MDGPRRWVIGLIVAIAIIGLVLFARGEPDGGRGDTTAPASTGVTVVRG
jgi:hypothetical protein